MKRVKQFDINNLFDFDLGYAIGDDKQNDRTNPKSILFII